MYPIEAVARKTGVNAATLRAWERRYNAVRPERTDTGRRQYSEEMLARTELLHTLLDRGFRIGEIAAWTDEELRKACSEWSDANGNTAARTQNQPSHRTEPQRGPDDTGPEAAVAAAVAAVEKLDSRALIATLDRAAARMGRLALIDDIVFPVLKAASERNSHDGAAGDHQELRSRFLTTTIRTFLSSQLAAAPARSGGHVVAIATPTGHPGEIGALGAALHVHAAELTPVYLGPGLAASVIAYGARTIGAGAVVLALDAESSDHKATADECVRLRTLLPQSVPVFFGGRVPGDVIASLSEAGLIHASTMNDLRAAIARLV